MSFFWFINRWKVFYINIYNCIYIYIVLGIKYIDMCLSFNKEILSILFFFSVLRRKRILTEIVCGFFRGNDILWVKL